MLRFIPIFLAVTVAAPALADDDKAYTMEDLTALVENEGWRELLMHANDIKPRNRKGPWKKMVEQAATAELKAAKEKGPGEAFGAAYSLPDQFPTLKKSKAFMAMRSAIGVESMDSCFAQARWGGVNECIKILDSFLSSDKKNADAHMKAGKIVRLRTTPHASAAPYFLKAIVNQKDKKLRAEWCTDEDVKLAVSSAFANPSDWPQAKDARTLVFKHCYKQLGDTAYETFLDGGTYEARNLCAPLKKKKKLSAFQKAHCKDKKD
jgi:hypothetical protein